MIIDWDYMPLLYQVQQPRPRKRHGCGMAKSPRGGSQSWLPVFSTVIVVVIQKRKCTRGRRLDSFGCLVRSFILADTLSQTIRVRSTDKILKKSPYIHMNRHVLSGDKAPLYLGMLRFPTCAMARTRTITAERQRTLTEARGFLCRDPLL